MRTKREELLNGQYLRRIGNFILWHRYMLRCQFCGNEKLTWAFSFGKNYELKKLSLKLNKCHRCGKMVCDDCFVISDGPKMIDGICKACAASQSISGKTTTQILEEEVVKHLTNRRN